MNPVLRGELWSLGFGPQFVESVLVDVCDADGIINPTLLTYMPGIFENATLPDPEPTFDPRWGYGTASNRNWYNVFLGKTSFNGSIGDMTVLNGYPLRWPIGPCATTPSGAGSAGTTLSGAHTAGAKSFTASAASYATNDIVCIGVGTQWAETRYITGGANPYMLNYPLNYDHATGVTINKYGTVAAPPTYYTHMITDGMYISPLQISVVNKDSDLTTALMRRYIGAKIGRASYAASEGTELRMSWDEILSRTMAFKDNAGTGAGAPFYNAGTYISTAPTVAFPATDPYYFSQGALIYAGVPWCRVRDFNLDVSNNLEAKYYICSTAVASRVPYELREGRKDYSLRMTVDITDANFFIDLCRMGTATRGIGSTFSGFDVSLVFTRGASDSITFTLPGTAAAAGGDSQGCFLRRAPHNIEEAPLLSVPLEILARNLKITVVDSIMCYP
jgi:hypothetical protein